MQGGLYPDVTDADWATAQDQLTLLVAAKVGTSVGDPRQIAIEAVRRASEPGAPVWDRTPSLASFLWSFALPLVANGLRKLAVAKTHGRKGAIVFQAASDGPEGAFLRAEENASARRWLDKLHEELRGDPCGVLLVDSYRKGERDGAAQALAAGFASAQVAEAREKIAGAVAKLLESEARAARSDA